METIKNVDIEGLDVLKIKEGLLAYDFLIKNIHLVDISTNESFQKVFSKFYVLKHVDEKFRKTYYSLFEDAKTGKVTFEKILRSLYKVSAKVHFSFTTKIFHSLDPSLPIYDSTISKASHIYLYGQGEKKIRNALVQYEAMKRWYRDFLMTEESRTLINKFDELFPDYKGISSLKKIDFLIWGNKRIEKV